MLSFPISPRSGQSYVAPNGQIYVWDGVKWLGTAIIGGGGGGGGTSDYSWSIAADDSTQREILAGETVKLIGAGTITTTSDAEGNITITGTGGGGTTVASTYSWSIAADDSTQREISSSETVKFIGAGGITTSSDLEGNITITGSGVVGNSATYQFFVAADDSTQRLISTDELIKFTGAGGITTASDDEGYITITQGTTSSLVNGASTVSLGSDGVVTFPGGVFTISNYQASTQIETWTVGATNISPTNSISFFGHSSKLFDTTWTISGSGITGQSTITAINPIMSVMSIIGYTVIIAQTISAGLVTGDYVFSNPPITQGVNLSSDLSTWTFGNDGSLTFPNGTVQTTAPESFSFSVAADDSTQRLISTDELIKFTGAGGITTSSDAEGNITITGPNLGTYATQNDINTVLNEINILVTSISYNDLLNKPNLAGTYQFFVAADDSTQRLVSTDELIKFTGAGGITTASDAEGNITINYVQGDIRSESNINIDINLSDSTLRRWQFGEDGALTLPEGGRINAVGYNNIVRLGNDGFMVANGSIFNENETGLSINGQNSDAGTYIQIPGRTSSENGEPLIISHNWDAAIEIQGGNANTWSFGFDGSLTIPGKIRVVEYLTRSNLTAYDQTSGYGGAGGPNAFSILESDWPTANIDIPVGAEITSPTFNTATVTSPVIQGPTSTWIIPIGTDNATAFTSTVDITYISSKTWTFGNDGSLTFPNGTVQTTAPESFSFSVAGDDSTQRAISNNELIKFIGAGTVTTSSDAEGNITITGTGGGAATGIESETDVSIRVNLSDSTQRIWQFGEDGSLTLPIGVSIDNNVDPLYPKIIGDSGKLFSVQGQGTTGSAALAWSVDPNADTKYAAVGVNQGGGDNLAKVVMTAGNTTATLKVWKLDETGVFTLPTGGTITDSGNYIKLTPPTGSANQSLLIYPTAGDGNHIHLTAGGGSTELYLGNDIQYVKLVNGGNVEVRANNGVNDAAWTFGTDGALTIPGDIKSNGNINIDINLSDSTLRRWHFGEDGELTVPGPISGLGNAKLDFTTYANVAYLTSTSDDTTALYMGSVSAELYAQTNILIRTNTDGASKQWTFGDDGKLRLPNNTTLKDTDGNAIAFGYEAGLNSQGAAAIAIGTEAGYTSQGANAVAVGAYAGGSEQGANAIAIGRQAGETAQAANSIILNATGATLDQTTPNTFTVKPVRQGETADAMYYNSSTGEITYADAYAFSFSVAADDSTQRVISNNELIKFIGAGTVTTSSDAEGNITITGTGGGGGGSTLVNGAFEVSLGATGNLTIPGDILSENEINIDLNLIDSTLRRWTFGQDGELLTPGNINTTATTFTLVNTTATTVNFAGAATTLTIANGLTSTTAQSMSIATGTNTGGKTINIGTGGGSATINLGSAVAGATTINSSSIQSGSATVSLFTSTSTNISFATAATTLAIGSTGAGAITTLNAPTVIGSNVTQNLYNTVATTVNEFGVATTINVASNAAAATTWTLGNSANTNTLTVAGGTSSGTDSITSTVTTGIINVFTGLTTGTLNIATGASATAVNIGGATSTITVGNGLTVRGPLVSTATAGITAVEFDTEQLTIIGNRISTTVTNANLELECNGTGGVVINNIAEATTASTARSVGYLGIPASTITTTNTLSIADAGEHIYVTSASQTITIPANASVAYPIGTTLTFIAGPSASSTSIAITSDTMYLAGTGTTGTRTLAAHGMATAVKVAATTWYINGTGLT